MKNALSLSITIGLAVAVPAGTRAADASSNPFFSASTLPYQAPPFDRIREEHYRPAFEEGMKRQLDEIRAIAESAEPPTFANTLEAMERSGELLTRVSKVFFNLAQSNTTGGIQKLKAEMAPRLAAHRDAIYLNAKLFARVEALYAKRDALGLDPESAYLLERTRRAFLRAGARLSPADQQALRALNQEESSLQTQFGERLLAETNASALVLDDRRELAGLSEGEIAEAAERAKERGTPGKWVLTLQNTTQQPALASLTDRAVRRRLFEASSARGSRAGPNDTREIAVRLARVRARKAKLLGFPTAAAYILDDQMAKTPANAEKLVRELAAPAAAKARAEAARLQKQIDAQHGGFRLAAWDWMLYSGQVRKAEYDIDEAQIKPYFELDRVLRDGVFEAAKRLYGVTFKERRDVPVYQPDVRVFEVFDADGKPLALYYGDYFARASKSGGAWCDTFVDQTRLLGTKPAVVNVTNFAKPAAGQPALLTFDNVRAIFHEFGHALHAMFSDIRYPSLGNTPRDFVEFPSQFNEHWALDPAILASYARHRETGRPLAPEIVAKIRRSSTFNQGYATTESLASALVDLAWHTLPAEKIPSDVAAFETAALKREGLDLAEVPPRYHTPYFAHVWSGDYAAGYYAYIWSDLLDEDAYAWFREHGGLTRENGRRLRELVLSRAGTQDAAAMYRAFRGRDPEVGPLLESRGLRPAADAAGASK
jgi:peptidyl-dipeptidase Dcp